LWERQLIREDGVWCRTRCVCVCRIDGWWVVEAEASKIARPTLSSVTVAETSLLIRLLRLDMS